MDAVVYILDNGIIDESGYLDKPFALKESVTILAKDIRMLQLAKSAICAGILTVINQKDVNSSEVSALYIASGFGNYLNKESAV